MTITADEPIVEKKQVVVFDICSSSNMLEDLILSQNERAMRDLIVSLKSYLKSESAGRGFEVYKFIGDGWILLFPPNVTGKILIGFIEDLCQAFKRKLKKYILPHLQSEPKVLGLTFGIDRGDLIRMQMMETREYIGRPLNIASRLQSAIKEKDKNPAYKVLLSKSSFNGLRLGQTEWKIKRVTRNLRNIQGGNRYACVKLRLRT
jgi:class 3 adenylate cyclase